MTPRRTRHGAAVTLTCEQVAVAPIEVIEGDIASRQIGFVSVRGCALEVIGRSVSPYGKAKDDQNRSMVATLPACGKQDGCQWPRRIHAAFMSGSAVSIASRPS